MLMFRSYAYHVMLTVWSDDVVLRWAVVEMAVW